MPEPQAPPAKGGGGTTGFLKRKLGPQPTWAWMAEVLGLALAYALYKQRKAAATSSTPGTTASQAGAVPADQVPDVIIQNELQGPGTTGPTTTPPPVTVPPNQPTPPVQPPKPPPPSPVQQVSVPNVTGQRANFAIGNLESQGLTWHETTGARNPAHEYVVSSQSPAPGTKVARGSSVGLAYKQIA